MDPRTSLSLRVGDADRARAEAVLQEAYSVGRLDERELDVRLGMAMRARTRQELSAALSGLPLQISRPALLNRSAASPDSTLLGSLAHGSGKDRCRDNSTGGDWFRLGTVVPGEAGRGSQTSR
jgi:hypothetical protein